MSIDSAAGRFVGARIERREDPRLLAGSGRYVDDLQRPGMLSAAFVRSPYAHAAIESIDIAAARALDDVVAVYTPADLDAARDTGGLDDIGLGPTPIAPPLASEVVRYVGEPVALVVARSRAIAEDAALLVDVVYSELPPRIGTDGYGADDVVAVPAVMAARMNVGGPPARLDEDTFAKAAHVVVETIHQHRYLPVPMEARAIAAEWDPHEGRLTVWSSTQGAHRVRDYLAHALGLSENSVRVIVGDVGGGFGLKLLVTPEELAVPIAARLAGAPIKWIEDRWENLVAGTHARDEHATVSMAFDREARLLAIHADHVVDVGAYGRPDFGLARLIAGPYRVGQVSGVTTSVRTDTSSRGAYRGPWMFETVARETMLDIAARQIGIDPLELRRRNVIQQSDLPFAVPTGTYTDVTPAETLDQAVAMLGYEAFRAEQQAARMLGRHLGVGIALFMEQTGIGVGAGVSDAVTLRVEPSGAVKLVTGVNSQGHSVATTMVQVVADVLGVDIDDISFVNGDTDHVPIGASTGGSRNAIYGGGAAMQAAIEMRDRIVGIAAHALEAEPGDIELGGGQAWVRGSPSSAIPLSALAAIAYLRPAALPPGVPPGLEVSTRYHAGPGYTWANAAHLCTCEVDIDTGEIRLLRYIVSEDCGTMINPMVVEGQISGGVVQGIGGALLERFIYDDRGNPLTTTFMDYLLPTTTDVPTIEFGHIETPSARLGGFKGVGEGGAIGAPAAVVNAVADALSPFGAVITSQPLTPERVLDAIRAGRTSA